MWLIYTVLDEIKLTRNRIQIYNKYIHFWVSTHRLSSTATVRNTFPAVGHHGSMDTHPSLALPHVQPVLVELDNVWVFHLHQVLKHLLDLVLAQTWTGQKVISRKET